MIDLESIREHLADELEPSSDDPKMFLCPLCGSGTGPHKTGALSIRPGTNGTRWRCFACGEHGNLFYLVAKRDGLTMADATRAMIAKYGSASTVPKRTEAKRKETEPVEPPPRDFSQEVQRWASSLRGSSAAVEYLRGRGITAEIQAGL